jgi:hypothetical protein
MSAKYCAPVPRPGRFFGQVVTKRHLRLFCDKAGFGNDDAAAVVAIPATAAPLRNFLRSMLFSPLGPGQPVDHIPMPSASLFFREAVMLPFF